MKINLPKSSGHSPKNAFLVRWVLDFIQGNTIYDRVKSDVVLPVIPKFSKNSTVSIEYGISHGKIGVVLVKVEDDKKSKKYLSFHLEFSTFKAQEISKIIIITE